MKCVTPKWDAGYMGEPRSTDYLLQGLFVVVQCGNNVAVRGGVNSLLFSYIICSLLCSKRKTELSTCMHLFGKGYLMGAQVLALGSMEFMVGVDLLLKTKVIYPLLLYPLLLWQVIVLLYSRQLPSLAVESKLVAGEE